MMYFSQPEMPDTFLKENLLVELGRVGVLEWQVATDHCVEDDSTAPNICLETMVSLAGDHLRRGVARRAAGCLQGG